MLIQIFKLRCIVAFSLMVTVYPLAASAPHNTDQRIDIQCRHSLLSFKGPLLKVRLLHEGTQRSVLKIHNSKENIYIKADSILTCNQNGHTFRIIANRPLEVVDTLGMCMYRVTTHSYHLKKYGIHTRFEREADYAYFFSARGTAPVYRLTLSNLIKSVANRQMPDAEFFSRFTNDLSLSKKDGDHYLVCTYLADHKIIIQ